MAENLDVGGLRQSSGARPVPGMKALIGGAEPGPVPLLKI